MIRFVKLPPAALRALIDSDLPAASAAAGQQLSEFIRDEKWLWEIRGEQIARDPASADWIARVAVDEPAGVVVGHGGFHGPPDAGGMVEVGYSVDPAYRRRGHARAMLAALIERARAEPGVRVVRASISPDNAGSLATIAGFGFVEVGEQWDEQDGLELVFELAV
ncbi:GNAT family N-acetyltransferase [Actinoplanes sp. NPDC026623]|uniref:GNAT family N-acetyltransferase n=1 Tax=Actinoplanes sp. NPDC026623 TaxID=3155610 RepID=UPI00340798FF